MPSIIDSDTLGLIRKQAATDFGSFFRYQATWAFDSTARQTLCNELNPDNFTHMCDNDFACPTKKYRVPMSIFTVNHSSAKDLKIATFAHGKRKGIVILNNYGDLTSVRESAESSLATICNRNCRHCPLKK